MAAQFQSSHKIQKVMASVVLFAFLSPVAAIASGNVGSAIKFPIKNDKCNAGESKEDCEKRLKKDGK